MWHVLSAEGSKTAASIESHRFCDEPSTAVSDAAVTIGGLTMRQMVDTPQPIDSDEGSYTAALGQATGVEAVEGTASFVTADDEDSPGTGNEAEVGYDSVSHQKPADVDGKSAVQNGPISASGTALLAHYEEVDMGENDEEDDAEDFESVGTPYTGLDTTRTVGAQSLAFMEGGQRYHHRPEAHFVPEVLLPALCLPWHACSAQSRISRQLRQHTHDGIFVCCLYSCIFCCAIL